MSTSPTETRLRLFLAVVPEPAALRELELAIERARSAAGGQALRWMPSARLHLTLRFLAAVQKDALDPLREVCAEVVRRFEAFELTLGDAGAFRSVARATLVWIGAIEGAQRLCALAAALDPGIDALGFERDARAFTPHLTLARSKRPAAQHAVVDCLSRTRIRTRVSELVLIRSHLGANPRYEALDRFALGLRERPH
jgi:2'-5' RNA ligase